MSYRERVEEWLDETNADRRLLLLLVLLLVLLGSGVGTFILDLGDDGETPVTTETPTATPTETPTPDGGGVGPATPGDTDTPTDPDTPEDTDTGAPETPATPEGTPTGTPTEVPDGGGGDGGADGDGGDGGGGSTPTETQTPTETPSPPTKTPTPTPAGQLVFTTDRTMLDADGIYPGQSGTGSTTVRSTTTEDGELRITDLDVEDHENGITDPESDVDDSPDEGELSEHVEVRIAFDHENRPAEYVLGTDGGDETLGNLQDSPPSAAASLDPGEEMDVLVEWQLPEDTGNVVQSDGVEFDVTFELRST